jgi:hypothetical protein
MKPKRKKLNKNQVEQLKKAVEIFSNRTGITKAAISKELGWSGGSALGNFLSGRSPLHEDSALRICMAVDYDPRKILGEISGSLQMHSHNHRLTAPVEKTAEEEQTRFSQNPGVWEIVEIDRDFELKGKGFNFKAKAGTELIIVTTPVRQGTPIYSSHVLYAKSAKSGFKVIPTEDLRIQEKGYKVLQISGIAFKGSI